MKNQKQIPIQKILVAVSALCMLLVGNLSFAQDEDEGRRFENVETTKVKAVSQAVGKQIEPVRAALSPEAPEGQEAPPPNPAEAIRLLNRIRVDSLAGHEKAEIWNLLAYSYYLQEDENRAFEYYERIVNEPEANAPLRNRTLKTVSQLCMIREDWNCALQRLQQWMALQQILSADDYALLSTIYYNTDDQPNALKNIEVAIEMRESSGSIGKENWYSIQRSIYYQRSDFRKVISILDKLIVNYPNVRYWRELGGMYAELEDSDQQMNAYAVAYLQDGLTSESQLVGMAYMYIGADVPYKAAKILVDGINDGAISQSEKNLQLVGAAYYQARELDKALPYYEQAAGKATSGEPFGRLAGLYLDMERYEDSIRTGREALRRRGIRQPHLVQLTLGTALFNIKDFDGALEAMRDIPDGSPGENAKRDWIRYINSEKRREQQLRDSGIDLDSIRARSASR